MDYFADLAACRIERDDKCKRPARDDERVQNEANELMKKVAAKAKEDIHVVSAYSSVDQFNDVSFQLYKPLFMWCVL